MSSRSRLLLAIFLCVCLLAVSSIGLAMAAVFHGGSVQVDYAETGPGDNDRINVVVPAGLAEIAIALVPDMVAEEVPPEIEPWIGVIGVMAEELRSCPDGVFVEVSSKHERVVVEKRGDRFLVSVVNDSERLNLSIPIGLVVAAMDKLSEIV